MNLKYFLRKVFYRQQRELPLDWCIISGIKSFCAIAALAGISHFSESSFIMAPFGASCILIFTTPESDYSQPINVIGGYLIAGIIAISLSEFLPEFWWNVGLMLSLTTFCMIFARMIHPPAGAIPVLVFLEPEKYDFSYIINPILTGSIVLIIIALILHNNIPPKRNYPKNIT